jgi:hypothetical protein
MTKWIYYYEYTFLRELTEKHLNELGELGWELVTLKIDSGSQFRAIYKKPKQSNNMEK